MKKLLIALIRLYQKYLSKGDCRYFPSCSQYMIEAIIRFGCIRGVALGIYRILRCNHFSKGGIDKVPDKKNVVKWLY